MKKPIEDMKKYTDLWPWYWLSYGEKCYAFAVVEAFQAKEHDPLPDPGTQLTMNEDGKWIGENGTEMMINTEISNIEQQNGDTICSFIAAAHAELIGKELLIGIGLPITEEPSHTTWTYGSRIRRFG